MVVGPNAERARAADRWISGHRIFRAKTSGAGVRDASGNLLTAREAVNDRFWESREGLRSS
eukprot:2065942-Alexandrium_andersonii.AAC.1